MKTNTFSFSLAVLKNQINEDARELLIYDDNFLSQSTETRSVGANNSDALILSNHEGASPINYGTPNDARGRLRHCRM